MKMTDLKVGRRYFFRSEGGDSKYTVEIGTVDEDCVGFMVLEEDFAPLLPFYGEIYEPEFDEIYLGEVGVW